MIQSSSIVQGTMNTQRQQTCASSWIAQNSNS